MNALFVLNDPPYGTERTYNGLRLALALLKNDPECKITVFLMADAVISARKGQKTPDGNYNVERMLKRITLGRNRILLCGTCMEARGMTEADMVDGAHRSTMDELAAATLAADKIMVF
ncbi:MAG: DsrE family protein [Aestuariivirga sp.]